VAGRAQNLRPWPKGVSGNPAGRPKNDISVEIARAVFENNPEAIYRGMARRLKKGDARVFKILADRAYGKVKENIELYAGHQRPYVHLSEAELLESIARLTRELGLNEPQSSAEESAGVKRASLAAVSR
jgi:hypothetical protein